MGLKKLQEQKELFYKKDAYYTTEAGLWKSISGKTLDESAKEEEALKEREKKFSLAIAAVKVEWKAYYYSRGHYKLGAEKAFEGFLSKRKKRLNALGIYSFADYKRLTA